MTGYEYTPVDEETGLVLPVLVRPEDFIIRKSRQHHKEHPDSREELKDRAGRFLRFSATQLLPDHLHGSRYPGSYHDIFVGDKNTPTDRQGKIYRGLLNMVIVPRTAIKLTGDGYKPVSLTNKEHEFISHPQVTRIQGNSKFQRLAARDAMTDSLVRYAIDETLNGVVSHKASGKFLATLDKQRERELGNQFIYDAVDEAIRPATVTYELAKKSGMVSAKRIGLRATVRGLLSDAALGNYYELIRQKMENPEIIALPLQTGVEEVKLKAA